MIPEAELKAIEARSVRYSERLLPLTEGYFEDREAVRVHYKSGALEQRELMLEREKAAWFLWEALIKVRDDLLGGSQTGGVFWRETSIEVINEALAKYEALKGKA